MATYYAVCSSPECTRSTAAPRSDALPGTCPVCGAAMVATCWKCGAPVAGAGSLYCGLCGVPLKRVLPRRTAEPLVLVCENPDCAWAAAGASATAMQTRCPACGGVVTAECWKCNTRITDPAQHYCARCGVPLKRVRPAGRAPARL
jgi:hypothetical protein